MANDLRVGISADASALDSGLAQAQAKVEAAAQTMAAAQQAATAATKNLAEAQAQLGLSAAAGNAQAQQILAQYQAEVTSTAAALGELTSATEANAAAKQPPSFPGRLCSPPQRAKLTCANRVQSWQGGCATTGHGPA